MKNGINSTNEIIMMCGVDIIFKTSSLKKIVTKDRITATSPIPKYEYLIKL